MQLKFILHSRCEAEHWSLFSWSQLHAIVCMQLWSKSLLSIQPQAPLASPIVCTPARYQSCSLKCMLCLWRHTFVWCAAFTQYLVSENASPIWTVHKVWTSSLYEGKDYDSQQAGNSRRCGTNRQQMGLYVYYIPKSAGAASLRLEYQLC